VSLELSAGIQGLKQVAVQRDVPKADERLRRALGLVGPDLADIERELERAVAEQKSPGAESAAHLLRAGGKRIRPMCVMLAARAVGVGSAQTLELALVAELVHLATLLHDDVVDDGSERRGLPTSRRLWGNAVSVLAGDHLLVQALERASTAAPGATFQELLSTLRSLVSGEIVQLRGRTSLDASRDVYDVIVRDKTASLFRWAFRAGARSAGATDAQIEALGSFGGELGLAFQIVDDVLDYQGDPAATGKTLLADLQEGKVTLPLLFAAEDDDDILTLLVRARAGDEACAREIAGRILAGTACERSRAEAQAHIERGKHALSMLRPTEARDLLFAVAEQVVQRAA